MMVVTLTRKAIRATPQPLSFSSSFLLFCIFWVFFVDISRRGMSISSGQLGVINRAQGSNTKTLGDWMRSMQEAFPETKVEEWESSPHGRCHTMGRPVLLCILTNERCKYNQEARARHGTLTMYFPSFVLWRTSGCFHCTTYVTMSLRRYLVHLRSCLRKWKATHSQLHDSNNAHHQSIQDSNSHNNNTN
ncbi:hypothetical protein BDP67DRAFT_44294 [Colletotrichum lupini]|nr:hypothetical protein BDP67DRAFT_44294 [Colletotrichum lupini]